MSYNVHFAPLQGYTDLIYREVHASVFGGVEAYYSPFVRLEKDGFRNKDIKDIVVNNTNKLLIPQLIASNPEEFRQIASFFRQQGYCKADINLGCPFPMQARLHRGAGMLPYQEEVISLLNTVYEFPELQFSVKLRLGWNSPEETQAILPVLNSLPLSHVTLHPRVGTQQYKGTTNLEGFYHFYKACKHPLFYNGDLCSLADIEAITTRFPDLKGVMLGRGLLSAPWLALEYRDGKELSLLEKKEKLKLFHALLVERYSTRLEGGEHQILAKLKTIWDFLLPDVEKQLRKKVLKSTGLAAYRAAVNVLLA